MGYNMKRGNSTVPFKELGSSPAKQTIKRRVDDKASVYTDADKTIVKGDKEKKSYTTYKTKYYDAYGQAYKPGEDIDEGELSHIKKKGTSEAHVTGPKNKWGTRDKLYLHPITGHDEATPGGGTQPKLTPAEKEEKEKKK